MSIVVSPSILSADFCNLQKDIDKTKKAGCDYLHFDVMDGLFVDNISFGIPVLKSVRKNTNQVLDVHLMIINPLKYIKAFADNGADIITFHYESDSDVDETISEIRRYGKKVGLSIKPGTPVDKIKKYIAKVDMILVMTVEPGFGGQGFIESTLDKIREVYDYIKENKLSVDIEVDGGINDKTAKKVKEAGAGVLVAGSYIFASSDIDSAVKNLL